MNDYRIRRNQDYADNDKTSETKSMSYDHKSEAAKLTEVHTIEEYSNKLDSAIDSGTISNFNSLNASEQGIENYTRKKRQCDLAMLKTEKYYLENYKENINQEHIDRLYSVLDENKLCIYNQENFADKYLYGNQNISVSGLREMSEGKIAIRDSEYINNLKKTSSHEATHDVSYQLKPEVTHINKQLDNGQLFSGTYSVFQSGIHRVEQQTEIIDGKTVKDVRIDKYRSLNEGLTEAYALEAIKERGDTAPFNSYSIERGLAEAMRDIVGKEYVDNAYFGGNIDDLIERFNGMSNISNAWEKFNDSLDRYSDIMYRGHTIKEEKEAYTHIKDAKTILCSLEEPHQYAKELKQ